MDPSRQVQEMDKLEAISFNRIDYFRETLFGRLTGPIICKPGKDVATSVLLNNAFDMVSNDPRTEEWIAFKYDNTDPTAQSTYGVFDAFLTAENRAERQLTGALPHELTKRGNDVVQHMPDLWDVSLSVQIKHPTRGGRTRGLSVGLHVQLEATAGKEDAIDDFLQIRANSMSQEEDTGVFHPYRILGTNRLGVMVFFFGEEAREIHLKGKFHQGLFDLERDGLVGYISVQKLDVLAVKLCTHP